MIPRQALKWLGVAILLLCIVGSASATPYLENYSAYLVFLNHGNTTGELTTADSGQTLTNTGTTIDTTIKAFGAGSLNFSGSAYQTFPASSSNVANFSTDNFTIHALLYTGTLNAYGGIISTGNYTTSDHGWGLVVSNTGKVVFTNFGSGSDLLTSSSQLPSNSWVSIDMNRAGNTFTLWQNGTQVATATSSNAIPATISSPAGVGTYYAAQPTSHPYTGRIDEIAVWKGVAIPISELYPQTSEIGIAITSAPVASYTQNQTSGVAPLVVSFTDSSTNTPTGWDWQLNKTSGNNTWLSFSSSQNPVYTFAETGNFSIRLNATNSVGYNISNTSWVNVSAPIPVSRFYANITNGTAPLAVQFTDTSYGVYNSQWQKQGTVLSASGSNTIAVEPTVLNGTPVILTGNVSVLKMWWRESNSAGTTGVLNYAESTDGFNWTKYSGNPVISPASGGFCPFVTNFSTSWYYLYIHNGWSDVDRYHSSDGGITWTADQTNIFSGQGTIGNVYVWNTSATSYYAFVEIQSGGQWQTNYETSSDGLSWTNVATIIAPSGGTFSGGEYYNENGLNFLWGQYATSGNLPTDIYRYNSTALSSGWGNATDVFWRTLPSEGPGLSDSQVADPTIRELGNKTYMWYDQIPNQSYSYIGLAVNDLSLSDMVKTSEGVASGTDPVITAWNWSFGDGSYSLSQNPVYTYTNTGLYNISLNVTNQYGGSNISTWLNYINVSSPALPVADFMYSSASGYSPLSVNFTDISVINITAWNWTFGAANYSSLQNPSYTFIGAGNYSVTLNVTNATGYNSITKYVLVTENPGSGPNPYSHVMFNVGTTGQIANQTSYVATIRIANLSSNTSHVTGYVTHDPAYYAVSNIRLNTTDISGTTLDSSSVGNGYFTYNISKASNFTASSSGTSLIDFNITNIKYANPGTAGTPFNYTSASTRYYDPGNSTWWSFNLVTGMTPSTGAWGAINATFTGSPTLVGVGSAVTFADASTGYPDAWSWDFGDYSTSTLQNPSHAYSTAGLYTVTETAYMSENTSVTSTLVQTNYINVSSATVPVAAFTGSPLNVTLGSAVTFTDQSTGSPSSWTWDFGDSSGSSSQNPTHIYTSVGNYTVNLTVSNFLGSNTLSKTNYISVQVIAPPVASFTSNVSGGQIPLSVSFVGNATNNPTSYYWAISNDVNPLINPPIPYPQTNNLTVTFENVANYTVNFSASNAAGMSNVATKYINAAQLSGYARQDLYLTPEYTLTVTFKDSSGNIIPTVSVSDSNGYNTTTTNGIFTRTYPYSVVAIYATSSGYASTSMTYAMISDRVETITLATAATSTSTTWYTPKTIQFSIVDVYGNDLTGAVVNANYNSTTLPKGVSDLINNYGMNSQSANDALNGTLIMTGDTDSNGNIVFTMLSSVKYDVNVTYGGNTNYYTIYPQDSQYQLKFIVPSTADNIYADLYANGNTKVWVTEPDIANVTFWWSFQDMTSLTKRIDFYLKDVDLNITTYTTSVTSPTAGGIYQLNYTVPNTRGKNYVAYVNYTRDV